jgi:hypothetical protein
MIGWKSIAALRGGLANHSGSYAANPNPTGALRHADVVVPCLLARWAAPPAGDEVLAGPGSGPANAEPLIRGRELTRVC